MKNNTSEEWKHPGNRQELLRSCGFRYFTTFQKGKPDFRPL